MSSTSWILVAVITILIIVAFILGAVALFSRLFPPSPSTVVITPTPAPLTAITPTPIPTFITTPTFTPTQIPTATPIPQSAPAVIQIIPSGFQTFNGQGFLLFYPAAWGILTCVNSPNFEFDPVANINQQTVCSFAQKPITVLISSNFNTCGGGIVQLGPNTAIKSVTQTLNTTNIQWCTVSQPVLKISHRISLIPSQSSSTIDFSPEIESMISTIQFR